MWGGGQGSLGSGAGLRWSEVSGAHLRRGPCGGHTHPAAARGSLGVWRIAAAGCRGPAPMWGGSRVAGILTQPGAGSGIPGFRRRTWVERAAPVGRWQSGRHSHPACSLVRGPWGQVRDLGRARGSSPHVGRWLSGRHTHPVCSWVRGPWVQARNLALSYSN